MHVSLFLLFRRHTASQPSCALCAWGGERGGRVWGTRGGRGHMDARRQRNTKRNTLHHLPWGGASDFKYHCRHHWTQPAIPVCKQQQCHHHYHRCACV